MKVQKPSGWVAKTTIAGLVAILAILAFLFTQYCSSCNPIHQSVYGHPLGIPLAVYGIIYVLLLLVLFFKKSRWFYSGFCFSLVVSLVLVAIQAIVLKQYCTYCLTCEGLFFLLWVINHYNRKKLVWAVMIPVCMAMLFVLGGLMDAVADDSVHYISDGNQTSQSLSVYTWDGTPAQIKLADKDIYYVSSWCDYCHELIKSLSPEDWKQIYVIDTGIKEDFANEKESFKEMGVDPDHMFFDLDHTIEVEEFPYIYRGKELK